MVARSISQSSVSTPIKATPTTIVTVKMPTTVPATASTGVAAANVTVVPASRGVSGVTVKKEPIVITGAHTVQKAGVVTTVIPVKQVGILFL